MYSFSYRVMIHESLLTKIPGGSMENIFIKYNLTVPPREAYKHITHYKVTTDWSGFHRMQFGVWRMGRRVWQPHPRIIIGQRHTHDILNCHLSFGRETDVKPLHKGKGSICKNIGTVHA